MEIKEAEKTVIAKPVAWRPGFSDFKSFSELLAGQVNASSPASLSETSIVSVRPKTVRLKPISNKGLVGVEVSGSAASLLTNNVPEPNVVYKPIAKLVSKTTASLLANLGQGSNITSPQQDITKVVPQIQPSTEIKHQIETTSDLNAGSLPNTERNRISQSEHPENDKKTLLPSDNRDRPAYDGHNWRKYGQKQVKGSEYTRSYYKCTYPNCPVKKKVEITLDGQTVERVYKGEHNHSNPQPTPVIRPDEQVQRSVSDAMNTEVKNPTCAQAQINEGIDTSGISTFSLADPPTNDPLTATKGNAIVSTSNNSFSPSGDCEEIRCALEAEGGNFKNKRRKGEIQSLKAGGEGDAMSESRVIVQNNNESEITGDGFRWRKYGQKVVKGNSYPRSYYRCTSSKCSAKKYVERMSEGTSTFITTYEGRHNHEVPLKDTISDALRTSSKNNSVTT